MSFSVFMVLGCQATAINGGTIVWTTSYKFPALLSVLAPTFTAIAYSDGTLHIHTLSGKRYT
jgi:hypothetical protein